MKIFYFIFLFLITSYCFAQDPCNGVQSVKYDGQTYHTLTIKNQCWFKENLNIGTVIPAVQGAVDNGVIEKACYDDNPANCSTYGGLYQWNEVMQYSKSSGTVKGICPSGWHVPSEAEFETLKEAVANDGNSLKALGQGIGDGAGTNTTGFSALMAIGNYDGMWYSQHTTCWWSSTEYDSRYAVDMYLALHYSPVYIGNEDKDYGFPVRCIKDNSTSDVKGNNTLQLMPAQYNLAQNFPNPFNPVTSISYQIPEYGHVTLKVYDVIGNEIATLVDETKAAGNYKISFNGSNLPSGIYYYELTAGSFKQTKKMTLMK